MRTPSSWQQLSDGLLALAEGIESRQASETIPLLLEHVQTVSEQVGRDAPASSKDLSGHITTATKAWYDVWPRLSKDRDFRLAIAREARGWAKRVTEYAS